MSRKIGVMLVAVCVLMVMMVACSWRQNDRCWISTMKYEEARELYLKTSSLDLVRQTLEDRYWTPGEINEAEYRLKKEFHLE